MAGYFSGNEVMQRIGSFGALDRDGNALFFSDGLDSDGIRNYSSACRVREFLSENSGLPGIASGDLAEASGHIRFAHELE